MGMKKVKLSLIANEISRETSFMKRKNGIMKKLYELSTLCGVQACTLIYSPFIPVPEFLEMSPTARTRKMMNQETYLMERITKAKEQLQNLVGANQELQYRYDAKDLQDLLSCINLYLDQLNGRIEILKEHGDSLPSVSPFPTRIGVEETGDESSSDSPILATTGVVDTPNATNPRVLVADTTHFLDANATAVTAPFGFSNHIQYKNMNMSQDLHRPFQHLVPTNFCDFFQNQNMNQVQYQAPPNDMFNQIQREFYNINLNQKSNQYMNQQQPFMNPMVEQHMSHVGGRESIPFMDGNYYNYNQLPVVDHGSTSYMPSTTGVYDPYFNNNL
ncbi:contains similarity to SRF-type transcription factor DNA-binding and dimerization domain (Pfam: transcript_fact.hmm, score 63.38) [Arabidopsis thaliana]|uniref:F21E10.14 protein n=1 Tax=Arabidopsis thaliana TaxID=3702 RepID=O65243_ARATH|nr:contains similarity to SRF-type transcription factor DNA-binding and dimerization domain (Pfam: transcript_fact.hmm, score 63.38) [Arabidopsis thaliana]